VPLFTIGCNFSAGGKRACHAEFVTEQLPIESRPDSVDRTRYDDPVSVTLGISALPKEQMTDFHAFEGDASRAAPGEDEAFEALRDVIYGRSPALSWTTAFLIAGNSSRLAPLADGIVKRFIDLSRNDASLPTRQQAALLATSIAALDSPDFAAVQGQLIDLARNSDLRHSYPLLYLRLANAGAALYSIYRDQFLAKNATQAEKQLAALAVCRIGQADSELISAIKSEWTDQSGEVKDDNYRAALFVALVSLGQEGDLRNSMRSNSRVLRGWYDAVQAGRGRTKVGPNNCMPMEWPGDAYVPLFMAPRLRWTGEQWRAVD
jgi:hypothetical protein